MLRPSTIAFRRCFSNRARPSDAYSFAASPSSSSAPSSSSSSAETTETAEEATTSTPSLSYTDRQTLQRAIRIDHAGELAANYIYAGQMSALSPSSHAQATSAAEDVRVKELVQEMWEQEKRHLSVFERVARQHDVQHTKLEPVVRTVAYSLGWITAKMGKESAMACTEAVETVIGEHYNDQLRELSPASFPNDHPSIPLLKQVIAEFRDDELEHLDVAVENDAQKAPAHALLSAFIAGGCRAAIKAVEKM
ncbi:COQ7-domain-containing protein [Atractiella rhizophila]|nr:COQ7-domain-containing protein [Atractiella rhizophila]